MSWGTGFVALSILGPVVLTNRHVVTGRDNDTGQLLSTMGAEPNELVICHHRRGARGQWVSRMERIRDAAGNPLWIEHPTLKSAADFVAVLLTQLDDAFLYPVELEEQTPAILLQPGEPISVIGYPFGKFVEGGFPIWSTGFLATELSFDFEGLPRVLIDCRTRRGQSGSPVLAFRGPYVQIAFEDGTSKSRTAKSARLLGINSGRINKESDTGTVWKAAALRSLVDSIR